MIIPRAKQEHYSGNTLSLSLPVKIFCADAPSEKLLGVLAEFLPEIAFETVESRDAAALTLTIRPNLSKEEEYYTLSAADGKIIIDYTDYQGGRNALASLAQLVKVENGAAVLPETEIIDWPDSSFRSFMADTGRKFIPMDEFKMHILLMAKVKLNKLHIHLSDSQGFSIISKKYPKLPGAAYSDGKQYTPEQMKELVAYAGLFGIDVIPEIDVPGHGHTLTKVYPQFACDTGDKAYNHWAMCIGTEETFTFIEDILTEITEIFPYEYIHIGTDEIFMRDISSAYAMWHDCKKCMAMAEREGLKTDTDLFYYFLRKVYKIVTKLGKKVMMWNDNIDISESPELPRDILIEFWRVAGENRGPREGCSMQRFLEEGFTVVNADYPEAYIDLYVQWDRVKGWDIRQRPAQAGELGHLVIGGETCAWETANHYDQSLLSGLPVFGDRFWNTTPITDEKAFTLALTRLLLGKELPEGFDLYDSVKSVIYVEMDKKLYKEEADREMLREVLSGVRPLNPVEAYAKDVYLKLL